MALAFNCKFCGQLLQVKESCAGKACLCPKCTARVIAPAIGVPIAEHLPPAEEYSLGPRAKRPTHEEVHSPPPEPPPPPEPAKPKKTKARKLTQDERFLSESAPWYVRHLHWVLLLALIPLMGYMFRPQQESALKRIERTLQEMTEDERNDFEEAQRPRFFGRRNQADPFDALPNQRIVGAWLPRDTSVHWLIGFLTSCFFLMFFMILTVRTTAVPWHLMLAALTTGTVGLIVLLAVQLVSEIAHYLKGFFALIFLPFKILGYSYHVALDPDSGFGESLFGFTVGVGICEEWIKLIPVIYYLLNFKKLNWHAAFLWGLASGAGFGIAEALYYSSSMYNGIMAGDVYFVRFLSCVTLHGIWSGCAAILLYMMRAKLRDYDVRWWTKLGIVAVASFVPVILHGLYDTFLKMEWEMLALVVALVSFGFLALLDYTLHQHRMLAALRRTGLVKV